MSILVYFGNCKVLKCGHLEFYTNKFTSVLSGKLGHVSCNNQRLYSCRGLSVAVTEVTLAYTLALQTCCPSLLHGSILGEVHTAVSIHTVNILYVG